MTDKSTAFGRSPLMLLLGGVFFVAVGVWGFYLPKSLFGVLLLISNYPLFFIGIGVVGGFIGALSLIWK